MSEFSEYVEAWIETEDGRREPLRGVCRIGRDPDSDIVINGPKVSRQHAIIHAQDEAEYWLIDLGSKNATFRNGHRVLQPVRLRDGDLIAITGAVFYFRQPGTARSSTATRGVGNATVMDLKSADAWLLIADIEDFTIMTQTLPPDQLAVDVGTWIQKGRKLVEKSKGRISKFLGDGFLACWESTEDSTRSVVEVLTAFRDLLAAGPVKFRVVVHHGNVTFGSGMQFGEENLFGPELTYIFRLEKLASRLGLDVCVSTPAQPRLQESLPIAKVPGEHELKGIPGHHHCFKIEWPATRATDAVSSSRQ